MTQVDWTQWNLSYTSDIFGPAYGGWSCIVATTNTLKKWLPTYIHEMNRQLGTDVLKIPQTYEFRPTFETAPRDITPVLLVDCPGTADDPQRLNSGIRSTWDVQVGVWLYGGQTWREVQALVYAYMAAIRGVLIQQGSLTGFAETTNWISETYAEREHVATKTVGEGILKIEVVIGNTVNPFGGPQSTSIPQLNPYPPEATVEYTQVTIDNTKP